MGKRIALGLRRRTVMLPFDGYDIGDHLPVNIKRGVVDTTRYGSGYWTLMGVEWRVSPTATARPRWSRCPRRTAARPTPT